MHCFEVVRSRWMLTGMDLLHPFLLSFDLRKRFQVIHVGLLASRSITQPTINVYTGPLCDCRSVADKGRARVGVFWDQNRHTDDPASRTTP
jgi:hypothetical protein